VETDRALPSFYINKMDTIIIANNSDVPVWIESIATVAVALFAMVGTVLAWISYRKGYEKQQEQIEHITSLTDSLSTQTKATKEQIEHLTSLINSLSDQTNAIKESNIIESQILGKLAQLITNDGDIKELEKQKQKYDYRPLFMFHSSGGDSMGNSVCNLINDGSDYALIKETTIKKNPLGLIVNSSPDRITKGNELHITLGKGSIRGGWNEINTEINLIFTDKTEKNEYRQIIKFVCGQFKVGKLEDLSKDK
jgi:hypothetical protein